MIDIYFVYKDFLFFPLFFFKTILAIAFPDVFSSNKQVKGSTTECCWKPSQPFFDIKPKYFTLSRSTSCYRVSIAFLSQLVDFLDSEPFNIFYIFVKYVMFF